MNQDKGLHPKISVIVPVYNAEKTLQRCVDSILAQTFTNFELILVNDGSTDSSARVLTNIFNSTDIRGGIIIKVIHKENYGASKARKTGVEHSIGEFIFFADADDTLETDCLSMLYEQAKKHPETDIIIGNQELSRTISSESYKSLTVRRDIYPAPWGKLYRKNLFDAFVFDIPREIVIGEDMIMNIRLAFKTTNDVILIGKHIYNYISNSDSLMSTHISTPGYELWFYLTLLDSIPPNERIKYMQDINNYCLQVLLDVFNSYPDLTNENKWKESNFYNLALNNIRNFGNPMSTLALAKIKYTSPLIRKIYFKILKIHNKLNNAMQ